MVVRTKLESGNVSIYMHVRRVNFRSYGALSDDAHNQQCETSHCLRRERCVRAVAFESSSVRSTLLLHTTVAHYCCTRDAGLSCCSLRTRCCTPFCGISEGCNRGCRTRKSRARRWAVLFGLRRSYSRRLEDSGYLIKVVLSFLPQITVPRTGRYNINNTAPHK